MISNERQYRMTRAELKNFEEAQAQQGKRDIDNDVDPRVYLAMGARSRARLTLSSGRDRDIVAIRKYEHDRVAGKQRPRGHLALVGVRRRDEVRSVGIASG